LRRGAANRGEMMQPAAIVKNIKSEESIAMPAISCCRGKKRENAMLAMKTGKAPPRAAAIRNAAKITSKIAFDCMNLVNES